MEGMLRSGEVRRWREQLLGARTPRGGELADDAARVELIADLDLIKSAACAVQAELAVALQDSVSAREAADGNATTRSWRSRSGRPRPA